MRRFIIMITVFLLTLSLFVASFLLAEDSRKDWDHIISISDWKNFSKNLTNAVKSENIGLQISAMQMVIKYSDKVDIDNSVINLVRLYRSQKDEKIRQIALVTIHAIQNDWALGIVKRDLRSETSPKIKKLMAAVINDRAEEVAVIYENEVILTALK